MGKTLYNELAHYYDLTDGNKSDDIEFYSRLANECGGPILDYGCGSGRLTIALAQKGYVIYATDPSLELVQIMRYQLNKQPDFIQERVHIIGLEEVENIPCVSLIVLAYNTFNEITDTEQQETLLRFFSTKVNALGILAMEVLPIFNYWPYLKLEKVIKLEGDGNTLLSYIQFEPMADKDLFRTICIFEVLSPDGELVKKSVAETIRRQISVGELTRLLNWTGFNLQHVYSSYDAGEISNKCLLVAARKSNT